MITEEQFAKVINKLLETQKYVEEFENVSKFDLFETPLYENCFAFFDFWVDLVVKEEFNDTIMSYLWPEDSDEMYGYNRPEKPLEIYYKDGAVNKIGTVEQLYTYIKENDGFRTNS